MTRPEDGKAAAAAQAALCVEIADNVQAALAGARVVPIGPHGPRALIVFAVLPLEEETSDGDHRIRAFVASTAPVKSSAVEMKSLFRLVAERLDAEGTPAVSLERNVPFSCTCPSCVARRAGVLQ